MPQFHSAAARVIGARVRDARRAQGISMDDLSVLAEISPTSVGKIERGVQSPSAETLVRLGTALNIDPGSLISGIRADDFGERTHGFTAKDFVREQQRRESRDAMGGA